jgi:hypothetical protein
LPENCKKSIISFESLLWIREWERMNRKEAITLLSELGANQLVYPSFVSLEQRRTENYQLKIKGNNNFHEIGNFLKNRFSIEEIRNFLIIYTP